MTGRNYLWLTAIIIGAIGFRLLLMTKAYAVGFDEVNYLKLAASGHINGLNHVLHTYWSPFYPLAVALFSYIVPNFELAGKLLSVLSASLIIVPVFFFVKKEFDKRTAFGASLLIAFFTYSATFSIYALTEAAYSFVAISGIIAGWYAIQNKNVVLAAITGIFFGMAYLTRPEGLGFILTFAGIIVIVLLWQVFRKTRIISYIVILLISTVGFLAMSVPYLIYLKGETGQWTISTKGAANQQGEIYAKNQDQFSEDPHHSLSIDNKRVLQDDIYHLGTFLNAIKEDSDAEIEIAKSAFLEKVFENYYKILTEDLTKVLTVPLLFLLGIGLFVTPWSKKRTMVNLYLLSFISFFWFVLIPAFHITLRYFVPLIPISLIWVALGTNKVIGWLSETLKINIGEKSKTIQISAISSVLVILCIVGASILPEFGKHMRKNLNSVDEWAPCIEQKKAGLWLKDHGVDSPVIMAKNHAVSFYAGNYEIKESVTIPHNSIERVLEYARYRNVDYIVLNDRYREDYPTLSYLLDRKSIPPQLKLIYFDKEENGLGTVIYQILTHESE